MSRPRKPVRPIADAPTNLRQRQRADGTWRVWWEPRDEARKLGFGVVELDAGKPGWSHRRAEELNRQLDRALRDGAAARRPTGRTIRDLIDNYRRSPAWAGLAPKTQQSYGRLLSMIETKWGGELVVDFTKPVMAEWWETLHGSGRVTLARALIRQMSILFSRAEIIGWRAEGSNPCFRLQMTTPPPRQKRAGWTELDALIRAADGAGLPGIGTAVMLLALQGQRSTDVRQARLSDFPLVRLGDDDDAPPVRIWRLTRQKRGTEGALILHPEVEARMAPILLRAVDQLDAPACPRPDTGAAYSEDLFIKHFNRTRQAAIDATPDTVRGKALRAALQGLQMRDLRRTFGILARAAGASREDVADALGNTAARDPRLYDTYMPASVTTASRAVAAIRRPKGAA